MTTTQADVVTQMIAALAITEPDLDTSVGSVTRKILDAVSQSVADSYTDQHLLAYQYDIDSKTDADLDDFVQLFGISRLPAKRATGVVTFYRGTGNADRVLLIPVATQVASVTTPSQAFSTVTGAYMPAGVTSVQVPVQASTPGTNANIGAGLVSLVRSPLDGIPSCTNLTALSGGTLAESDAELRERWKRTVFRSLAGTEQMYLGVALNDPDCSQANVIGASKTYRERVQVHGGVATSSLLGASYIYANTSTVGPDIDSGQIMVRGLDYTFDSTYRNPLTGQLQPRVLISAGYQGHTVLNPDGTSTVVPVEGMVVDLTFEYGPSATRNRPGTGATNRVDVWCSGSRARQATQTVIFQNNIVFSTDAGSPYFFNRFVRPDHSAPTPGNLFMPLAFGPIITLPTALSVGGSTFTQGIHYFLVHDDSAFGYGSTSLYGIEWSQDTLPDNLNVAFDVAYTYNEVPVSIQGNLDRWRLTGIDAMAHQARTLALRFSLAAIYQRGANIAAANTAVQTAISTYLSRTSFDGLIQVSDILQIVHNVPGVDAVRFLNVSDYGGNIADAYLGNYALGIQQIINGKVVKTYAAPGGNVRDVSLDDSQVAVLDSIAGDTTTASGQPVLGVMSIRAENTFYPSANSVS